MMTREQHLLSKLAEEGAEVAQMALKTAYFGQEEVYVDLNNRERLHRELDDLLAVVDMLNEEFAFGYVPNEERMDKKKDKVNFYAGYSTSLGRLEGR